MTDTTAKVVPIALLAASNVSMTFAWYGHPKFTFAVPASRIGHANHSAAELKTMQEVITLLLFAAFSVAYLKEALTWNHAVGFALVALGAFFVFKGPLG